ncbi:MAG: SWIM zinc finger family protein [Caldicoprobacter oshimai]|nr:MAG: metal-binding protein [Caldicoprobacter oshimai]
MMASRGKKGFGSSWWAKQWLEALESFGWDSRLTRGRAYARNGNVLDVEISPGRVKAHVQGSRKTPYKVEISMKTLSQYEWDQVLDALASKAIFSAKLLAGEMPDNIEEAFSSLEVSLFPRYAMDLSAHCTCPDGANPCKHIAAVYYILAQEFDRDPFLLFKLRGMNREQIMEAIRNRRTSAAEPMTAKKEGGLPQEIEREGSSQHDAVSLINYWTGKMKSMDIKIAVEPPLVEQSILKRLGEPPFFAGKMDMIRQLEQDYKKVLLKAITVGYKD